MTTKLWDGSSAVYASQEFAASASTGIISCALSGIATLGSTTTVRHAAACIGLTTTKIKAAAADNAAGNTASTLVAVKIA